MNENQLTGLKQFITSTVKEEVGELRNEMNLRFQENDVKLNDILNEILNAIGHRFNEHDTVITQQSATIINHENRLLHLEGKLTL